MKTISQKKGNNQVRVALAVALSSTLLAGTGMALPVCNDFEAQPVPGPVYAVGSVFTAPVNATVDFLQFQEINGIWNTLGVAEFVASNWANGSPNQELNVNDINVGYTFLNPPDEVRLHYADIGGNINFGVNGVFLNVPNLNALHNMIVGNVRIKVVSNFFPAIPGANRGHVQIKALPGFVIEEFLIGGHDFYIDDVCHQ